MKTMTATINAKIKTKKAAYWLSTAFAATAYLVIGTADLLHAPAMMVEEALARGFFRNRRALHGR
jgi:hypothetical protein